MWHVSIALRGFDGRPVETARVVSQVRTDIKRLADRLLAGVGQGPDKFHRGRIAFHLRRSLTNDELARIDQAWLALPAIDGGTEDEETEVR